MIDERCAKPRPPLILVLQRGRGESNPREWTALNFDEFGFEKVSFPAQLSVK